MIDSWNVSLHMYKITRVHTHQAGLFDENVIEVKKINPDKALLRSPHNVVHKGLYI